MVPLSEWIASDPTPANRSVGVGVILRTGRARDIGRPTHFRAVGVSPPECHARGMELIRRATRRDLQGVLSLWTRADAPTSATDDEESLQQIAARHALLVAEVDNALVGSLIAAFDGWRGNMYRLVVDPGYRRHGVARRLVEHGERQLADQGCVRISALVLRDERAATRFWSAAGYQAHDAMTRFVKTRPSDS
jgi:GNAT superfamily N-acetyltransferase